MPTREDIVQTLRRQASAHDGRKTAVTEPGQLAALMRLAANEIERQRRSNADLRRRVLAVVEDNDV